MRTASSTLALVAAAFTPTAAIAQSLTLTNLKVPIAKASGKAPAKSVAELWTQINGLAAPAAATPVVVNKPGDFDAAFYLKSNPDVAAAGIDARQHYDRYGRWEGRLAYAGAARWKADASTPPSDFAAAPACALEVLPAWAPAGSKQIRIRYKLTRFGDGTPCERSYSVYGAGQNPASGDSVPGYGPLNISGQDNMMIIGEALSLPSQGSQGELVIKVPEWAQNSWTSGWFNFWLRSAEYNEVARGGARVYLGGDRPAGTQYNTDALVLPAATSYPGDLGTAAYTTDFASLDGWRFSPGAQLNGMVGVFTTPDWKTASGKLTDNYPLVNGVRQIVMRDHRTDPVAGKYLFSTGIISRVLGDGIYGYRKADIDLPKPLPGTDAAYWGIKPDGSWPPEFDTHEGFASIADRMAQTIHMPVNGAPTIGFTPKVDVYGRHEWLEEFGRQTYRLWLDRKLVVERPNYLAGISFETTFGNEGPGGAGGAVDLSQPYDGMTMSLYRLSWWQR